jgi:hypothetical protein
VREKLAAHSTNPTCHSCHGSIDPLGFALENFDVDGTWRTEDRLAAKPIDSLGTLPDGTDLQGPNGLRDALLRDPERFAQMLTEKLMTYALGRPVQYYDMPAVRKVMRDSAKGGYRFSSLVIGIVESEPFQQQAIPAAGTAAALAAGE